MMEKCMAEDTAIACSQCGEDIGSDDKYIVYQDGSIDHGLCPAPGGECAYCGAPFVHAGEIVSSYNGDAHEACRSHHELHPEDGI